MLFLSYTFKWELKLRVEFAYVSNIRININFTLGKWKKVAIIWKYIPNDYFDTLAKIREYFKEKKDILLYFEVYTGCYFYKHDKYMTNLPRCWDIQWTTVIFPPLRGLCALIQWAYSIDFQVELNLLPVYI